ncbi:hypothetical protein [Mesobacillus jeotgali]|uniref:hypothetical protein n=1 Tax=Mesobacillus jeotgali TaxID=129985 RepID=UPI0009A824F0|nr:hypothetical protein [Mesobacillus jeotgali]
MDDHRRKIITNEIQYWKQSKLLPEHYCDFLLNLYTEGSLNPDSNLKNRPSRLKIIQLAMLGLLSLSVLLFYFTELSLFLQTGLMIFFGVSSLIAAFFMLKNSLYDLIVLLSSALVILITTVQAGELLFPDVPAVLYIITAVNCLLWLAAGAKWNLVSFKVSGVAGLLVLLIAIFI